MRRLAHTLAFAALLSGATFAYANLSGALEHAPPSFENAASAGKAKGKVRGNVDGLYPGAVRVLRVRVRNRFAFPVRVVQLRTKVKHASPDCTRQYLKVRRVKRPKKLLEPEAKRRIRVKAQMLPTAPDACQGARWPLRFRARFARQ